MAMLHEQGVQIINIGGHYEARVNGQFVVSGDTEDEVHQDLIEMGYLK